MKKILQGDSLSVLKTLDSELVDIVVTSPPYNLGNNHHTGSKRVFAYQDDLPEYIYQQQQRDVLAELYRVLKPTGSLFYNHKNRIKHGRSITPYEWLLKTDFVLKQELVWFNRSQNFDKIRFYPMTERVYWLAKSTDTKLQNVINHHDLFQWKAVGTNGGHVRAFPEEMVRDILSCFPDAKVVLDPYIGSGTTAVVAKEMGKHYIGIEINKDYIKQAEQRLGQELLFN